MWFEGYFDPVVILGGKYWVGLDLEGKDRNRIIARNLNEGEMQSLTLALERAFGVKAELKPLWEVIEEDPPTVIAIFAGGAGLKQAYRIAIDRNGNSLTVVNSRSKEKIIPLTTVRQVWSQALSELSPCGSTRK